MIYLISLEACEPTDALEVFEDRIHALPNIWFVSAPRTRSSWSSWRAT
jgi:hypothetical protein